MLKINAWFDQTIDRISDRFTASTRTITLAAALLITVVSAVLFSLAPAWQSTRVNCSDALKEGGRSGAAGRARQHIRSMLVVSEMALAHTVGDKVENAYRRTDLFEKRRRLMADWAQYCASVPATSSKVVPMRSNA